MPTSSIFLDPKIKEAIRVNKDEVSEMLLDKREKLQKKKPTKWKWSSLLNAFKEMYIMADPGGVGLNVGVWQAKKQKEKGITPTVDNNWALRKFRRLKELSEEEQAANEKDYIDVIEDYEKGIYKGAQNLEWAVGDLVTAGIDLGAGLIGKETNLNRDLTESIEANRIADPETLVGDAVEILVEYGIPGGAVFKIASRLKKIEKLRKIKKGIDASKFNKISNFALKVGGSAGTFGAIDFIASTPDRDVPFAEETNLEGLEGKERALASLGNRLRFGAEGAVWGAGFSLLGRPLALGFKYGIFKPGMFTARIGFQALDKAVVRPATWLAARTPGARHVAKGIYETGKFTAGEILPRIYLGLRHPIKSWGDVPFKKKLPTFAEWRNYSQTDKSKPLEQMLKGLDNKLSWVRSIGPMTGEQYTLTKEAKAIINSKQRTMDKTIKSLEVRATNLAKAFNNQYKTNTTSPASMDAYLDKVLAYLKNQVKLNALPVELREMSKFLKDELMSLNKEFGKMLPKGELRDAVISTVNPYLRQSFAVFTNPYFQPTEHYLNLVRERVKNGSLVEGSKAYNQAVAEAENVIPHAVKFITNLIEKDKTLKKLATDVMPGVPKRMAINEYAKRIVDDIVETGRADGRDPLKALQYIARDKLYMDDIIVKTGKELPDVIKKLLGEERHLKAEVLSTGNQAIVHTTNKIMGDNLAQMGLKIGPYKNIGGPQWLFRSKEEAIAKGYRNVLQIRPDQHALLQSELAPKIGQGLWGDAQYVNALNGVGGKLDNLMQSTIWRNLLQFKVAVQYGKTVLSPATQVRNVTSASLFSLASGHIGGRATVTEGIKMVLDDVFGAGKIINEQDFIKRLERKIRLRVLDENIVASELKGVFQDIKAGGFKSNGKITSMQQLLDTLGKSKFLREGSETATRLYAGGDNMWKWYGHEYIMSQYKQIFKNLDDVARWYKEIPGLNFNRTDVFSGKLKTLDEAIEEAAAWTLRNTYPTYSKVPEAIKMIRKIPFFGNFVSFPAEMTRTSFNLIDIGMKEAASSNPLLRQIGYRRLLGTYTVMGGASTGALKLASALTGVTSEQLDAYKRSFAAEWNANSVLIPIDEWVDGKGKAINFSYFSPYNVVQEPIETFFNSGEKSKKMAAEFDAWSASLKAFGKFVEPFVSRAIFYEKIQDVLPANQGGSGGVTKTGSKVYSETDNKTDAWWKSIAHVVRGAEPGLITTGGKVIEGIRGESSKSGQLRSAADELTNLFTGIRIIPVDIPKSMEYKLSEFNRLSDAVDDAEEFYSVKNIYDGRIGPKIIDEFRDIQEEYFRVQQNMYFIIQDAIEAGLDANQIRKILRKRKMPNKRVSALLRGEFIPWQYNKTQFKSRVETMEEQGTWLHRDDIFPKRGMDEVIRDLRRKELFLPWDESKWPGADFQSSLIIPNKKMTALPKKTNIQTPPLPDTPMPDQRLVASMPQVNQQTGLTRNQSALLSPTEQLIARKQNQGIMGLV
jgi:uncharacterized protein (UPF0335 family)